MGQSTSRSFTERGLVVSVVSSFLFAGVYFVTPLLAPASAESLWGIRNIVTIPLVLATLLTLKQLRLFTDIARRIRARPVLLVALVLCGFLVGAQLWLFSWAPLNGRGLQVALGYFLLPLVLVVIGKFLYKDRLLWWHWLAAAVAGVGVIFEIVRVGTVSWETMLVALGYPVYFVLRRALGTNHLGGMLWEFVLLSPLAVFLLLRELTAGDALQANPSLVWFAPLFAVWSGIALICYLLASRYLSISLFGLMSYLEPALLVVASLLIGERISSGEWPMYIAVWAAVGILVLGGAVQLVRASRSRRGGGPAG
ncbi:EamA family transporter RarD [Leucobacter albus]|uniref:EamA family transporter RarD n=1 Tax=Leucobacter albus TaxID=272210 RepID=A0ABW3TMM8_9MICO